MVSKETLALVTVRQGIVDSVIICKDREELHDRFSDVVLGQGEEPSDEDFDLGYHEFENDKSVNMVTVRTTEGLPPASGCRTRKEWVIKHQL